MIRQTIQNKGLEIKNSWLYWKVLRHSKQVLIVVGAYFLYMFIRRYLIADIETVAIENAIKVTAFEFARGFLWEPSWQAWVIEHSKGLAIFFNWVYILTFWPIIIVTAFIAYVLDRQKYFYYRNLILISLVISLIVFMLFPLAPPEPCQRMASLTLSNTSVPVGTVAARCPFTTTPMLLCQACTSVGLFCWVFSSYGRSIPGSNLWASSTPA